AGLFGPVRLARPSACLGEISGGRINGGASPPFVRVKAEDSSLKNIRFQEGSAICTHGTQIQGLLVLTNSS
ncbi:MAG: hypothetical protein LWW81_09510, partial [Rhodocyclales bacterium]|nr:hypothetical protein [Rhodocyclales bacterium]